MTDYKKYALGQVENFLYDAMSTDATPQEIYDVIKGVVQDNLEVYTKSADQARELLSLLNGHRPVDLSDQHSESYYDFDRNKPLTKTCHKNDTSPECKKSWNDFWVEDFHRNDYTDEELDAMCTAAEVEQDMKNVQEFLKKDKVVKWILPVEETKVEETDETEYFITFPDDLLESANLKEGDQLEWIDQGDGSCILKKVKDPSWVKGNELAKVKTYQEMIDDGWSMTDDGFWIREKLQNFTET
jgi:bifunctional DNA-binding transcriptional regulator/antitoxin component of YhaV-PrlF toxin-antitoxin module